MLLFLKPLFPEGILYFIEKGFANASDIFAACFFHRLYTTQDPWEATRFAVRLAAFSVTRAHFQSIPTEREISDALIEVI